MLPSASFVLQWPSCACGWLARLRACADLGCCLQDKLELGGGDVVDGRLRVGHHDAVRAAPQQLARQGDHAQHSVRTGVVHQQQSAPVGGGGCTWELGTFRQERWTSIRQKTGTY
jgi:hypothetical protein